MSALTGMLFSLLCGRGQDVGNSPSIHRIWDGDLRPGVYPYDRFSLTLQHLLDLIKGLHPSMGNLLHLERVS